MEDRAIKDRKIAAQFAGNIFLTSKPRTTVPPVRTWESFHGVPVWSTVDVSPASKPRCSGLGSPPSGLPLLGVSPTLRGVIQATPQDCRRGVSENVGCARRPACCSRLFKGLDYKSIIVCLRYDFQNRVQRQILSLLILSSPEDTMTSPSWPAWSKTK